VIERDRIEKPEVYLKVIASLLPKDLNLNVSRYDHLTDEQLISRLRVLSKQAAPLIGGLIDQDQRANVEPWLLPQRSPEQGPQQTCQTAGREKQGPSFSMID
jgi:hypothetical protein